MASPSASVTLATKPLYLKGPTGTEIEYSANDDRRWFGDFAQQGVIKSTHLAVTWVSGLQLQVATGRCYVLGQDTDDQGMYRCKVVSNTLISVGAGHATLPRIDTVVIRVFDDQMQSNGLYDARIEVIPGTPTSGAQISNSGAGNYLAGIADLTTLTGPVSKSVLALAYVLVPANASALTGTSTNVLDARVRVRIGNPTDALLDPWAMAQRDAVDGQVITYDSVQGRSTWSVALPVGTVIDYAGASIPSGFLAADGAAVSRTTYARLLAVCSIVQNGTLNNTVSVIGLTSTAEMRPGMIVEGTGIPAGTTINTIISGTEITLSAAATTAGTVSLRFFLFGGGDGSTTFNVPDLRGRVATGQGTHADVDKVGDSDSVAVGSRAPSQHTHTLNNVAAFGGGANSAVQGNAPAPSNFPYFTVKKCIKF